MPMSTVPATHDLRHMLHAQARAQDRRRMSLEQALLRALRSFTGDPGDACDYLCDLFGRPALDDMARARGACLQDLVENWIIAL